MKDLLHSSTFVSKSTWNLAEGRLWNCLLWFKSWLIQGELFTWSKCGSCINLNFCYFQLKTGVIMNKDIIFLERRFIANTEWLLHQHLWVKHCVKLFLKVQLNSWIQKASPAANTPGYPQPLSSEGVDLEAFQHFVCLTGNFYSPLFILVSSLCLLCHNCRHCLTVVAYPSNVFLSGGKLRMGREPLFPFPCYSWSMTAVIMASKLW